jgi:lipopolysaccharide/colanic/teichoic acid biosynthesis glycosyltransferase
MKRLFDIGVSLLALVVLSPVAGAVAIAVRLSGRGPVLHRGTRTGLNGQPFILYKFRTMTAGAALAGPGITSSTDVRITRVGKWLRTTKLDELPQLINVLRGEMSLVGPRPEDPRYVALYTPEQRRVLSLRPGIVSPAAIAYRHEEALLAGFADIESAYLDEVLPRKLAMDLEYIETQTFFGDLRILGRMMKALVERAERA